MESLRGIGQMSRESGLTVSALRFYDAAGVLGPAVVDPQNGYRFYAPDQLAVARLVAMLRRVGMPLAGIRGVLAVRHDPDAVAALAAEHVARLERGLLDARRTLSSVRELLAPEDNTENPMSRTFTVPGPRLAAAWRAVRFAVGVDPDLPVLGGVLFDVGPDTLTLVATDRYRLAIAPVPITGPAADAVSAVVPVALADRLADLAAGPVTITVDGDDLTARSGTVIVRSPSSGASVVDGAFPDYRRLLPAAGDGIPVDVARVRAADTRESRRAQDGANHRLAVVHVDADGQLQIGADTGHGGVGVNVEFLLQALDAGGPGQLMLELDGPIAPLVVRSAGSVSLLMPVRLDRGHP